LAKAAPGVPSQANAARWVRPSALATAAHRASRAEPAPARRFTSARAAALAGSVAALILASLLGGALGSVARAACRAGAWNVGVEQYQAHCYTDIYPLYFDEGLAAGKVPYFGHHVQYPVVMGEVMQVAAWVVRDVTDPAARVR